MFCFVLRAVLQPLLHFERLDVGQWHLAPSRPQMQLDYGQVSCGCAEFQALIDDFTWTVRLDFFQALVSNEFVENSPEG
jgi:hypothetical protein